MATEFQMVSFALGSVFGCLSALMSGYLLFQTKGGCREMRAECGKLMKASRDAAKRDTEMHDQAIKELQEDIKALRDEFRQELSCTKGMLTALILYSDIPEDKRAEILRS